MYRFYVPAMTCDGCARAITRSIQAIDANARVTAIPAVHRVEVESPLSKAELLAALEDAGYGNGLVEQPL